MCGTDLSAVRAGLEKPDAITASAVSARAEIGHAIAAKIKEFRTAKDLRRVTEEILPKVEKFLESPQERRLRRIRDGVITSAVGLGAALIFFLLSMNKSSALFLVGFGVTLFLIGISIVINGMMFTVPDQQAQALDESMRDLLNQPSGNNANTQGELPAAPHVPPSSSVIEHTTHRLSSETKHASADRRT
jgi:hypothetical protein